MPRMEDAFARDTPEVEIEQHSTALLGDGIRATMGRAILTNDRIMFFDKRFDTGAGAATAGIVGGAIVDRLQKAHEAGAPLLDLPLSDVLRVSQTKRLLNKDIIVLETKSGEYRLNDGFKKLDSLLRRLLTERFGRTITEEAPGVWSVAD
ncbi:MAG: hypothetical protein QOC87_1566 [Actinomycetota bacterium]|nr:hypothetical protein [Actinomycetota bacterium]